VPSGKRDMGAQAPRPCAFLTCACATCSAPALLRLHSCALNSASVANHATNTCTCDMRATAVKPPAHLMLHLPASACDAFNAAVCSSAGGLLADVCRASSWISGALNRAPQRAGAGPGDCRRRPLTTDSISTKLRMLGRGVRGMACKIAHIHTRACCHHTHAHLTLRLLLIAGALERRHAADVARLTG
jgi:hypothetical protein